MSKQMITSFTTRTLIGAVAMALISVPLAAKAAFECPDPPQTFLEGIACAGKTATDAGLKADENLSTNFAENIIFDIIAWLFGIAAAVALAVLVWGAFTYIVSLGQEDRTRRAKSIILYAVIGLIVLGFSFTILYTVICAITPGAAPFCPAFLG